MELLYPVKLHTVREYELSEIPELVGFLEVIQQGQTWDVNLIVMNRVDRGRQTKCSLSSPNGAIPAMGNPEKLLGSQVILVGTSDDSAGTTALVCTRWGFAMSGGISSDEIRKTIGAYLKRAPRLIEFGYHHQPQTQGPVSH